MQWIELGVITTGTETAEKLASILGQYGQGGAITEETESSLTGERQTTVKIYLANSRSYKKVREEIVQKLSQLPFPVNLIERRLKPEDWFESLKRSFGILEIGERLIIKPSWKSQPLPVSTRNVIELDPGAAFGTGLHATTRLCLLRLEKHLRPGMSALDLGTGSGILSIAAAKLGAASVLALDIDPVAVKAARSNAKVNAVDNCIQVRRGTLSLRTQRKYRNSFDIVLANITARAISELSQAFSRVLKPGGILVVSGIQSEALDEVLISLALEDFNFKAVDQEGEWQAVTATKE